MKPSIEKRLTNVENKIRWRHADQFFKEWLQEHPRSDTDNIWEVLETVPQEFKLEYLNLAFNEMRKARSQPDAAHD